MNKAELSQKIADKIGITKIQAEKTMEAFTDIAISEMKAGGEVVLTGFGTFSARARKGREGINPRNPEEKITIPTVVVAKFKAGKNLKDALKGKTTNKEDKKVEVSEVVAEETEVTNE